ncbi:SDR family NAD(P)-dependent oxidoreductase [Streptomyces canus]|uniref:3-oxoacyl-[acyl-carrier protein] reductase n=1 Tax=Streptomyces canus TaxID=58343 RepID=A0AAW8FIP4_9ACTN|nr:SDR family NAD(P)-dependent oxidoreductase [Streptomyces canus]MDQ0762623.1 3-oxoacyl-[acyl-carrier protein] reductase [Streptomyces canus]MDQ0908905.1 3-oxoacyl-[acyl-carrier protein] reductase [Streptomyces canus]MDQ1068933.1 3-oxoacyl-[acyl-carrier protein] reductase [Streptomyces canus]
MTIQLDGRTVLLTGGTRGIGRGIALALARSGARLLTCSRHDDEAAQSLQRELKEIGPDHHVMRADVSRSEDIEALVGEAEARFGSLDAVVANAGAITHVPFDKLTPEDWHRVLDTNLTGTYLLVQKSLPLLGEGSSVIAVGSRSAMVGIPLRAHYTASKAGLVGLTRSLAKELGPRGIRVNVVAPGVIEPENEPLPEETRARYRQLTALGRLGRPEEVAGAVLFLASTLSAYVTGETLHVDGGI